MNAREMQTVLKDGGREDKIRLFEELVEKTSQGPLEPYEVGFLEALRKDLTTPEPTIVQMSATLASGSEMGTP